MVSVLSILTILLALATLLPMTRCTHWMVRILDFPRLQIGVFAAMLVFAHLVFLERTAALTWVMLVTTTLCMGWQLWWIAPYTMLWPKEVRRARGGDHHHELSILTSNVLTPNHDAASLIRLVRTHRPDIVVTLESDQWWEDQLKAIATEMPHSIKCPLDNLYGMHVFSRLALIEPEISFLVEDDVPSIHSLVQMRSGDMVRVHFIHPAPPSPTENPESGERDAELIIVARSVAASSYPVIVAGDLNDVAWSATTRLFRKISGLLDPRIGRGLFNTFHADYPFLRWPLDHLFHSDHFTLRHIQRLPTIGSDHFPLLTSLRLAPHRCAEQDGLSAEEADREWAKSITRAQRVQGHDVPSPGE